MSRFTHRSLFATPWHLIRLFFPLTGLASLAVYTVTLFPDVFPGYSASLTAIAAGLWKPADLSHPLFAAAARAVAQLPWGTLTERMNLFCASCGAIAVSFFYLFTARLVFICACEDPGGAIAALPPHLQNEDEEDASEEEPITPVPISTNVDGSVSIPPAVMAHNWRVAYAAVLGGLCAAFALAFCAPFWIAATRLYPHTFDLMLLLMILNLLISYDQRAHVLCLFLAIFLMTFCSVESGIFLALLPLGVFFLLRTLALNEQITASRIIGALLIGLAGTAAAIAMLWQTAEFCSAIPIPAARPILSVYGDTLLSEWLRWLPTSAWGYTLAQIFLPAAIALFLFAFAFRRHTTPLFLCQLLMAGSLVPSLLNLSLSPWRLAAQRADSPLPVFSYALITLFAGLLIAVWRLMREPLAETPDPEADYYENLDNRHACRFGAWLCWSLLAVILAVPLRSFPDVNPREGQFVGEVCDAVWKNLGPVRWIVNDTLFRYHLMLRAHSEGRSLFFVSTAPEDSAYSTAVITDRVKNDPAFGDSRARLLNAADLSTGAFFREWLSTDTNAYRSVATSQSPDFWHGLGFIPLPMGCLLAGSPVSDPLDPDALLARHQAFTSALQPYLFPPVPDRLEVLTAYRTSLRQRLALEANELACLLAARNRPAEAANLLTQSVRLDPDNVSLLLNRYTLVTQRGVRPETLSDIQTSLFRLPETMDTAAFRQTAVQAAYGTLIDPDTLEHVRRAFWLTASFYRRLAVTPRDPLRLDSPSIVRDRKRELVQAISKNIDTAAFDEADSQLNVLLSIDTNDVFAAINKAHIAIERQAIPEARQWIGRAQANGAQPADLIWHEAALQMLNGESDNARNQLENALAAQPTNLRLWALLANVLIRQGDYRELENRVYPSLYSAAPQKDTFLIHQVRGYISKSHGPQEYAAARADFIRALELNPLLSGVREELLQIDNRLDVPAFCEQDAKAQLLLDPDHAFANYLLGMVRLRRGEYEQADDCFRRSLEKTRSAPAYAGLGAVLLAQKRIDDAERLTRRALELDPALRFAWLVHAQVLLAAGQLPEAAQALATILKEEPDNAEALLTLVRIRLQQHNLDEAAATVATLLENQSRLTRPLARQLHTLAAQVSAELAK